MFQFQLPGLRKLTSMPHFSRLCGLAALPVALFWMWPAADADCDEASLGVSRTIQLTRETPPVETLLEEGEVILTFDDGPHMFRTRPVLKALNKECTRATFFLLGKTASAHPGIVREILDSNHTIGSHSQNHANLGLMGVEDAMANVMRGKAAVEAAGEIPAILFRLPYISTTPELSAALRKAGFIHVTATVDGADWTDNPAEESTAMIMSKLEANGRRGIILLHDPVSSSDKRTRSLLEQLREQGYRVVAIEGPDG